MGKTMLQVVTAVALAALTASAVWAAGAPPLNPRTYGKGHTEEGKPEGIQAKTAVTEIAHWAEEGREDGDPVRLLLAGVGGAINDHATTGWETKDLVGDDEEPASPAALLEEAADLAAEEGYPTLVTFAGYFAADDEVGLGNPALARRIRNLDVGEDRDAALTVAGSSLDRIARRGRSAEDPQQLTIAAALWCAVGHATDERVRRSDVADLIEEAGEMAADQGRRDLVDVLIALAGDEQIGLGDRDLADEIEEQPVRKSPVYGTQYWCGYVGGNCYQWVYLGPFWAGEYTWVDAVGYGWGDLDAFLVDENGNVVSWDTDYTSICWMGVTPRWTGPFWVCLVSYGGPSYVELAAH